MALNEVGMSDLSITVLCGGASAEREISLQSGRAVHQALLEFNPRAKIIELQKNSLAEVIEFPDIFFIALHGEFGEDGELQCLLEKKQIAYVGSRPAGCACAFDKLKAKAAFVNAGIATPDYCRLDEKTETSVFLAESGMTLPLVIKPVRGGSSQGVTMVEDEREFQENVRIARNFAQQFLVEKRIVGREITVGILDGKVLPVIELKTKNKFYDYQAKYEDNDTLYFCPAPLSSSKAEEVKDLALRAFKAVGAEHFARVDLMLDAEENASVLELNIIPGFTSHSLLPKAASAAGFEFPALCRKILELGWQRYLN